MDKNSIVHQTYINTEYAIVIKKKKGEKNSTQLYSFNHPIELQTGIASMTEQLIKRGILMKADILQAVRMGAKKGEAYSEEKWNYQTMETRIYNKTNS